MSTRRHRRAELPALNVTALVDVLLVLLCFLMLAATSTNKRLPVEVPSAQVPTGIVAVNRVELALLPDGKLLLDGSPAEWATVAARIQPTSEVEVQADKQLSYQAVVTGIERVHQSKPASVSLVVR